MSKRRKSSQEEPLLEMRRPAAMRWLQLALVLGMIALTLVMVGRGGAQPIGVTLIAAVIFILLCLLARQIWRADANSIIFDGEAITDENGATICRLAQVQKVERGMAMFKPSGGFLLVLDKPQPGGWVPGLWWRYGRRVGVGGTTPTKVAKVMADAITQAIAARETG